MVTSFWPFFPMILVVEFHSLNRRKRFGYWVLGVMSFDIELGDVFSWDELLGACTNLVM